MLVWIHLELPIHMKFGNPQWHFTQTALSQTLSKVVFWQTDFYLWDLSVEDVEGVHLLGPLVFVRQLAAPPHGL